MNKSKFLKKSLAMLLALMLVLAMIPLSASAAGPDVDISFLYIDKNETQIVKTATGGTIDLEVYEGDEEITVGTNEDLSGYGYVLYAKNGLYNKVKIPNTIAGEEILLKDYAVEDQVTLQLFANDDTQLQYPVATYVINITYTDKQTTTLLDETYKEAGDETYRVDKIDNEARKVYVTVPYEGDGSPSEMADGSEISVKTIEGATVDGKTVATVSAVNGAKFEVVSESTKNKAEYTVVATPVNSLNSFTVNGVAAVPVDTANGKQDGQIDEWVVTLPKSALVDAETGDTLVNPEFKVKFAPYGDISNLSITPKNGRPVPVKSGDDFTFTGLAVMTEDHSAVDYTGTITTTCLGVTQTYDLTVTTEKDTNTTIEAAWVWQGGSTIQEEAKIEGANITAVVPTTIDLEKVVGVRVRTPITVTKVVVGTSEAKLDNDHTTSTYKEWTATVNLKTSKTITVTSENNSTEQYTISVSQPEAQGEPAIESLSLEAPDGTVYSGTPNEKYEITLTVPYMTLDVSTWVLRVTAAANTEVVNSDGNSMVSGRYTGGNIGLGAIANVDAGISGTIIARDMYKPDIVRNYTVKVVLEDDKEGNKLNTLEFTSQKPNPDPLDDKIVYRAKNDDNTFKADIDQANKTITLKPALSLAQDDYQHIVTDLTTEAGGVAFFEIARYADVEMVAVKATTSDDKVGELTGTVIAEEDEAIGLGSSSTKNIIVLPEKYARDAEKNGKVSMADVKAYGTTYTIKVEPQEALHGADLKTFKIGDVELEVSGNKITGELPWSYTVASPNAASMVEIADGVKIFGYYAEFTVDKYAELKSDNGTFNSNGDANGDGDPEAAGGDNLSFVFVQAADNKVEVYRADGTKVGNKITSVTVHAEDRLDANEDEKSTKTYDFELTYAEPNPNADIESFKLGKYEGTISGRNITVNVPYKTDVKGLVATYTASLGSKVTIGTTADTATELISGVTSVNYSNPVVLYVQSEKKDASNKSVTVNRYTVTVNEAEMFTDVSSSKWYYDYVLKASNLGIINGKGDGIFAPEEDVTRGDFAVMLTNMLGVSELPHVVNNPLADVNEDIYYSDAIAYCYDQGYIGGYPDGSYRPEATITRQEAAKIIAEALELTETDDELFTDDSLIHEWAEDYVYQCKATGIFGGDAGTGNFRPTDAISRAETAKIMVVAYNNK